MTRKVLLIGATGVFGNRLARHLAGFSGIELILTSRRKSSADKLAEKLARNSNDASIRGICVDTNIGFDKLLCDIRPFIVVDCSGPFQESNYNIAKAVFAAGSHFVDIGDARDYLAGYVGELDHVAKQNDVTGIAGASSTPALSGAVVVELAGNWRRIDVIDICITPGGKSIVGKSVLSAVLSYAGKKIPAWNEGELSSVTGWQNSRIVNIPTLGKRRVGDVETYDGEYLGNRYGVTSQILFSAGLESRIEQRGIECVALMVKTGLIKNAQILVSYLHAARKFTRFGMSDSGGMAVVVVGLDKNGEFTTARWSLLAENDHGPYVPVLPAAAAIRAILQGKCRPGAKLAPDCLGLSQINSEMTPYSISTITQNAKPKPAAFPACLGDAKYSCLPAIVQEFHNIDGAPVWAGRADIDAGEKFPLSLVAYILGLPKSGKNIPLCVSVERKLEFDNRTITKEKWTRNFDGQCFSSVLKYHQDGSFTESFGFLNFEIGLDVTIGTLTMPVTGWRIFGFPLPRFLRPISTAIEYADEQGRFRFDVKLSLPFFGLLAHYRGWLMPKQRNDSL